jgi:hypothetical protein
LLLKNIIAMKKILIALILCVCLMPAAFGQLDKTWRRLTTTERMTLLQFKATDVELEKGPNNDTVFLVVNRNTGVVDTFTMDELRNCIGTPITDTSLFAVNAGLLQGKDTTDIWAYVEEHTSAGGGESYFDSTAAGMIFLKNPANKLIIGATTSSGTEKLNVYNGSVLFDGTTGATPVSGAGTRMMWIPSKAAFRAGIVTGTQWDDALVGIWSYAFGRNSTASGHVSFCVGENCTTIGRGAFAGGNSASAPGEFSMSFGNGTQTPGQYSVAFNNYTISSGAWSFACGVLTVASGSQAFSSGWKSVATGISSFALGDSSRAMGKASFAGGRGKAYGAYSFAWGDSTNAQSYRSAVFGYNNVHQGSGTSWVDTDDLFVVGNGYSAKNNAFKILKNGTAYIGDASSTTDPILTVSTTDSTTTLIGILKLTPQDDPPVSASEGMIYADTDHHLYYYNGTAWVQLD